jgi:mRNA interferase MazF
VRRGEIGVVDLETVRGAEADRQRPAVIVSNDGANGTANRLGRGMVTVVPVTSNTERVFPFQVLLPAVITGLAVDSKAQAEQVRSIAVERIGRLIGRMPVELQADLDEALRLHLGLTPPERRR